MGDAAKKIVKMSWEEFDAACENLAALLKDDGTTYSGVFGIPRGGLVPAVRLSHLLHLPLLLEPNANCLVVDDISDSGKTLRKHEKRGLTIVTLYTTPWTEVVPEYFMSVKRDRNSWIEFPWERMG